MQRPPFVWLGSRRTRKYAVSQVGRMLDEAASAGLPVPPGAILLDEFYRLLLEAGIVQQDVGLLTIPEHPLLMDALYQGIRFPRLDYKVTIRPMFSASSGIIEIEPRKSPAVDFTKAPPVVEWLSAVWQTALTWELHNPGTPSLRRDVVLMKRVNAVVEGTAVCRSAQLADVVQHSAGNIDATLQLPRLGTWQRPGTQFPPFGQRLQKLLRGIRRTIGTGDWQIHWADDGRICWLLEIRPLAD